MNITLSKKKSIWTGVILLGATAVLVACGGGSSQDGTSDSSGFMQSLGVASKGGGPAISWTPSSVAFSANPGARQALPVTFTADAALSNVTVSVVPELRNLVTASPTQFASLSAGQSATVILHFSVAASETLRTVDGTVHIRSGSSTVARPLPVTLALVAPETLNGVTVPPEPPKALNDLTLAGFDTNGNGVRDDVERMIAREWPATREDGFNVARQAQLLLSQRSSTIDMSLNRSAFCALATKKVDEQRIMSVFLNTEARFSAYTENTGLLETFSCE
jgi:hypothetical protein